MGEETYKRLREFLDALPGGYPSTDSGVELKILKKLFTQEEAELTMGLRPVPEPVGAIAGRWGMGEEEAAGKLESLARKGLIFRVREGDTILYMAIQFVVGIMEFQVGTIDRELAELLEVYMPYMIDAGIGYETKQLRVVPVDSALDTAPSVATYDRVREIIKKRSRIAVAPCICRKEQGLLDNRCDRPLETCFAFGTAATYYIDNGLAREVAPEEALNILDLAEESALVLAPSNTKRLQGLCCCCGCCCGMLRALKTMDRPADHVNSSFQAFIEPDLCSACEVCLERCQIDAIVRSDGRMRVDTDRCTGCGLCVSRCPENAISLTPDPRAEEPPDNIVEMMMRIAAERGVDMPR